MFDDEGVYARTTIALFLVARLKGAGARDASNSFRRNSLAFSWIAQNLCLVRAHTNPIGTLLCTSPSRRSTSQYPILYRSVVFQMSSTRKSYYLAPSWDIRPEEVTLGSVVANFRVPQRTLSAPDLPSNIDSLILPPLRESPCSGIARQSSKWNVGLFATFLQAIPLGGELSFSSSSTTDVEYSCALIETRRFTPSLQYIAKAAEDEGVKHHLKTGGFGTKAFVITGIKVAHEVGIATAESKESTTTMQIVVDTPIAQLTAGPKGTHESTGLQQHTRTISGPIVFAFQVEKLRLSRKGKVKNEAYIKGAMLGQRKSDADDSVIECVGGSLDEDESVDFGVDIGTATEDDTGEACEVIIPTLAGDE